MFIDGMSSGSGLCPGARRSSTGDRGGDRGSRWPWRRLGDRLRLVDRSSAGRRPVDLLRLSWGSPRRPFLSFSDLCSFLESAFFFFSFFSFLSFGGGGGGSRGTVRGTSAARASRGGVGGRCDPSIRCFRSGAARRCWSHLPRLVLLFGLFIFEVLVGVLAVSTMVLSSVGPS